MPYAPIYALYLPDLAKRTRSGDVNRTTIECPFHDDKNGSASFYNDTGIFYCPVCNVSLSPAGFIQKITGCSAKESDVILSEYVFTAKGADDESFFSKTPRRNPDWDSLVARAKTNLLENPSRPIIVDYLNRKGLKFETLVKAGVGVLPADETSWKQESLVFPYMLRGHCYGIRYRNMVGEKNGEPSSSYILGGLELVPNTCDGIIIVEGDTDRLTCMELFPHIPCVNTPSCKFSAEWKREFNGIFNILYMGQNDSAAENLKNDLKKVFGEEIINVDLPWKRGDLGKDVNDWAGQADPEDQTRVIETVSNYVKNSGALYVTGEELDLENAEENWILNGVLARGYIGAIIGPAKAKKSFNMFNMIRCLLTNEPYLGKAELTRSVDKCKILVVEEEGTKADLVNRAKMVLADTSWKEDIIWMHKKRVQIDQPRWINKLAGVIEKNNIDVLFLDCWQELHTCDENQEHETAIIWTHLRKLLNQFPNLAILFIHHFNKAGDIFAKFKAVRGSSRMAGALDMVIFQDKIEVKEEEIIRISFDGKMAPITNEKGGSVLECTMYDGGIISTKIEEKLTTDKKTLFYDLFQQHKVWKMSDIPNAVGAHINTIRRWINEAPFDCYVTPTAPGQPAMAVIGKDAKVK